MGKSQTNKSRYQSRYSQDSYVTGQQFIVELICENKARKEKKVLPLKFWNNKEWSTYYRSQLIATKKIINKHNEKFIVLFLSENKYIISLRPKWVIEKIDEYVNQKIKEEKIKTKAIVEVEEVKIYKTKKQYRTQNKKTTWIDLLDEE